MAYLKLGDTNKTKAILDEILKMQTSDGGVLYFTREIPHGFVDYPVLPVRLGLSWYYPVSMIWICSMIFGASDRHIR